MIFEQVFSEEFGCALVVNFRSCVDSLIVPGSGYNPEELWLFGSLVDSLGLVLLDIAILFAVDEEDGTSREFAYVLADGGETALQFYLGFADDQPTEESPELRTPPIGQMHPDEDFGPTNDAHLNGPVCGEGAVCDYGANRIGLGGGDDRATSASADAEEAYRLTDGIERFDKGNCAEDISDFFVCEPLSGCEIPLMAGSAVVAEVEGEDIEAGVEESLAVSQATVLIGAELVAKDYGCFSGFRGTASK